MKNPKISILILILVALAMYPLGTVVGNFYTPQGPTEITSMSIGDTVIAGTKVVNEGKIRKVPVLYSPQYLQDYIENMKFMDIFYAIATGTVKTPIERITSGSISKSGVAQGFNGPGILEVKGEKLTVSQPGNYVYGQKMPYMFGIKTANGLEIVENDKTIKLVPYDQISNDTIPHDYVSVKRVKKWYSSAALGDQMTLGYAIVNFNDGRNIIAPESIETLFGSTVQDYMEHYPSGSPVLVYSSSNGENVVGNNGDTLGSFPQYNDAVREQNSRAFVEAWNGTIIPPHSTSSGKETVGFGRSTDPHAPGGWASHGVCPAARALRGAVSQAGFGLPTGLTWGEYAVLFGFNPATDVKVTNTNDYPVKILMWTEGSGPGMRIYAKVIEYIPK